MLVCVISGCSAATLVCKSELIARAQRMNSRTRFSCPKSLKIGSNVLGVVVACHVEHLLLDVGSDAFGYLPRKAICDLQGKSQVQLGAVIHAVVNHINSLGHIVLSCTNANGCRQVYGVLNGGVGVTTHRRKHRSKVWWKVQLLRQQSESAEISAGSSCIVWMSSRSTRNLANMYKVLRASAKTKKEVVKNQSLLSLSL